MLNAIAKVSADEKAAVFGRHEFFRGMSAEAIGRMSAHTRVVAFPRGARIFARGDESQGLMAVLTGLVRISVPSDTATELTLNLVGPNGIFGELALIDGQPRSADATALAPCTMLLLERRDFLATLKEEPAAALSLLQVLSARLRRTSQQLEQASFRPMEGRLAQALLSLEAAADPAQPQHIVMPQRQIGSMVGLSRESTNKFLRKWQRDGAVRLDPHGVTITDRDALQRMADTGAEA